MPQDYNFLSNYVTGLINQKSPDDEPLEDDNDLYDIQDNEDEQSQDTGDYGIDPDDDQDNEFENDNTPYQYNDPFEENESYVGSGETPMPIAPGTLGHSISDIESGGRYNATNKHSSAVGKYQFLWNTWGDSIKNVTGVSSKDEFLHSPKAQEKYYAWYEKNYLMPQVKKLQIYNKAGLSDQQLAKLVHYRGAVGAKKYLQGKLADKTEKYNIPISQYLGTRRVGGIAATPQAQHEGLNNANFDSMYFPMHGENEFRGLDDGSPIFLEDEEGRKKILRGKRHRAIMRGNVFERKLK